MGPLRRYVLFSFPGSSGLFLESREISKEPGKLSSTYHLSCSGTCTVHNITNFHHTTCNQGLTAAAALGEVEPPLAYYTLCPCYSSSLVGGGRVNMPYRSWLKNSF